MAYTVIFRYGSCVDHKAATMVTKCQYKFGHFSNVVGLLRKRTAESGRPCLCAWRECLEVSKCIVDGDIDGGRGRCFLKADVWRLVNNQLLMDHHSVAKAPWSNSKHLISHGEACDTCTYNTTCFNSRSCYRL